VEKTKVCLSKGGHQPDLEIQMCFVVEGRNTGLHASVLVGPETLTERILEGARCANSKLQVIEVLKNKHKSECHDINRTLKQF
jgi:hypothetical protein